MNDLQFQALVALIREPVLAVRRAHASDSNMLPDQAGIVRDLEAVHARHGAGQPPLWFWAIVGCILYGNERVPFTRKRVEHAVAYLKEWQRRGGAIMFRDASLLLLLFLYGLGVRRPAGSLPVDPPGEQEGEPGFPETPEQVVAWGAAPWPDAVQVLHRLLMGLGHWLISELRGLGLREVEMLGEFGHRSRRRSGDANGQVVASHTIGILLGHTRCVCAPLFRAANPGSPPGCAETRHERRHLLTGYLDGHWPAGRRYSTAPFSLTEHIFRAVCGGPPTRPRALEEGIWFSLIRVSNASLVVLKVIVCGECRAHLSSFEKCPGCNRKNPPNKLMDWLTTEDDARFQPGEGKECRRCESYADLNQGACRCGSPGLGFTRVIAGTGRVECRACNNRQERTAHACTNPNCLNADYGGVTRFHVRNTEPRCDVPLSSSHRGSGVFRQPMLRNTQVVDSIAEQQPEQAGQPLPVPPAAPDTKGSLKSALEDTHLDWPKLPCGPPQDDDAREPTRAKGAAAATPEGRRT